MAFENWKGDYLLRMAGAQSARLQSSHGPKVLRLLSETTPDRLRSLNYPGRDTSFALVLKNNGLMIREEHEIGALDTTSPTAIARFVERWHYVKLPIAAALKLFAYREYPDRFDRRLVIRNIVFQAWLWTRRGILPPVDNIVRRGWYQYVKPVLAAYRILVASDYNRYFEELRYLTRVRELGITYQDFGFIDHEQGTFWDVGAKRPEVLLYCEKSELKKLFDELNANVGASYLLNHGQPNRFQIETLALKIAAVAPGKTVHMIAAVDFNPGGFAIEGAGVEGLTYHGVNVQVHRVLELRALSTDEIEEFRAPLAEAIRKPDGQVEVTFGSAANFAQCENWFAGAVQDPRFREEKVVPEGTQVTYFGFDMDVLGEDWMRYRLSRLLQKVLQESNRPRAAKGERGWEGWLDGYRHAHGLARKRRTQGEAGLRALVEGGGQGR